VISNCRTYNYALTQIGEGSQCRAVIIDDEMDICFLLRNILRNKNIQAHCATSLSEAEKTLQEVQPPLVFLDNHLPDGMGVNYISKLKQELPGAKVIMITAHDTAADREKAYKQGADFFISKPFTKEIILETIKLAGVA
jgi:two-component system OmpR family response regulator